MNRTESSRVSGLKWGVLFCLILGIVLPIKAEEITSLNNAQLTVSVNSQDGSFEMRTEGSGHPVLTAQVAAEIDHGWLKGSAYPRHQAIASTFDDLLGHGHQITITFSGLNSQPDLLAILKLYDARPLGVIEVRVRNNTARALTVQAIRSVEAIGEPRLNLGGNEKADRILSDMFSEDIPILGDLAQAPHGVHRAAGSQLIYNQESGVSLLLAALASRRFLTIMHLRVAGSPEDPKILSYTVDSTGTTEFVKERSLLPAPPEDQIELSLPLLPGKELSSEPVMFTAGRDYHAQLSVYAEAIRLLHHARVSSRNLMGWWSWASFYAGITDGEARTNAQWLAEHLKTLGYDTILIDEGYQYARGEYATPDASQFPGGMRNLGLDINRLGLTFGVWTGPFEVSERAWVYEHHKDWLVHNAQGKPLQIYQHGIEPLYVLDTTHPGAQGYLRATYRTLVREWGVRYIKLNFMDESAVEGFYYRPHTTALEAQRLGLEIIRAAVGDDVLLNKDGSPMLNPVGIVDEGRISDDTVHSFEVMKEVASGIAERYYMNRKFFVSDPDAYTISGVVLGAQAWRKNTVPLTLQEAQMSIVLAAVSGGMYEIGDDLPTLAEDPPRFALVENQELLQMVKLEQAAVPIDLMTYRPEDGQPSVFLLHEDRRQTMLAVFNWTEQPRSHAFSLADLNLRAGGSFEAYNVLDHNRPVPFARDGMELPNQAPHSVRAIKIIDTSVAAAPPSVTTQGPAAAEVGKPANFTATFESDGVPVVQYHWDFGDGTSANGAEVRHTYTRAGTFSIQLEAEGADGIAARKTIPITINGVIKAQHDFKNRQRYVEPGDR